MDRVPFARDSSEIERRLDSFTSKVLSQYNFVPACSYLLQIRDGRCGLIEEIFARPVSPASPTRSSSSSVWSVDLWRRMSNF